jgi:pimeloyl-ACP methyl ester carboxylesterase
MPRFETKNGVIHYDVIGAAGRPPLTLLHNFMSTGERAWGAMLDGFSRRYRVLLPDLPGHGRSQGYPPRFDHRSMARQLAALMAVEGATNGHLAGVSSGGMIAQLMVYHRLASPATLTLVSTSYTLDPDALASEHPSLTPDRFQPDKRWLEATARLHDPYHDEGYYQQVLLPAFRSLDRWVGVNLPLDAFSRFHMPVCLIHGEEDQFFPPAIPTRMAAAMPNAQLHLIPGQAHGLIFRRPWQVQRIMDEFLTTFE